MKPLTAPAKTCLVCGREAREEVLLDSGRKARLCTTQKTPCARDHFMRRVAERKLDEATANDDRSSR